MDAEISQWPVNQSVDPRVHLQGTDFEEFLHHPAVQGRLFYTLPEGLLSCLCKEVELDAIDPELYRLESALSSLSGDHASRVGYWNGAAIRYQLLRRQSDWVDATMSHLPSDLQDQPGWMEIWPRVRQNLVEADEKLKAHHVNAAGYCGWLNTNQQFVAEHDSFFETWHELVVQYGLPQPGPAPESVIASGTLVDVQQLDSATLQYCREFRQFLDRWRLNNIQSPYLPQPLQPQAPVLLTRPASFGLQAGGALIHVPDIAPLPDRDSLRTTVESAIIRTGTGDHLREWQDLVSADNQGKKKIERFARLFQLQHFWKVLHRRWGNQLRRKAGRIQYAFAAYLLPEKEVTAGVETIRKDLAILTYRLGGGDWQRRASVIDSF